MGPSHSAKMTEKSAPTTTATMIFDDELQEQINSFASAGASAKKFIAFIERQENKKLENTEAFLRLTQAMIYHFDAGSNAADSFGEYFTAFIDQLSLSTETLAEKCLPQLQPFFTNIPALSEAQHLNACLFAYHVIGVGRLFRQFEWKPVVDYLVGVVQNSGSITGPAVLWAVLALELATRQGLDDEQLGSCLKGMKSRQDQLTSYFHKFNDDEAGIYSDKFDALAFQVGFLLSSYLNVNNYFPYFPPNGCFSGGCIPPRSAPPVGSPRIAICPPMPGKDFYEIEEPPPVRVHYFPLARNDDWQLPTVRSALSLSGGVAGTGVFYYEAVLISSGKKVAIGWATREATFSETKGVGDDQYGAAITSNGLLHNGEVLHKVSWKDEKVIGCLIDLNKQSFSFYANGKPLATLEVNFSAQPYFAAASLGPHEQVWFNYGQVPFKYPPNNVAKFDNIHAACGHDTNQYRLMAPTLLSRTDYCFKDTMVWDAPVEAMFVDDKQDQLDQLLIDLEVGVISETEFKQLLPTLLESTDQFAALRLFNSVLTEVGYRTVLSGKSDEEALEKLFAVLIPQLTAFASKHPLPFAKLIELLLPYSQNRSNECQMYAYQNVALILLALLSVNPLPEKLSLLFINYDELDYYFNDVLCMTGLNNSLLYKLITVQVIHRLALLNVKNKDNLSGKEKLQKQSRIVNQLKYNSKLAKKSSASAQAKSSFDRLRVKLATASQAALDAIFSNDVDEQVEGNESKSNK